MSFFSRKRTAYVVISSTMLIALLSFQNCSKPQISVSEIVESNSFNSLSGCSADSADPNCQPALAKCNFNGLDLEDGEEVTAYLASSVENEGECASEVRTCSDGDLSGSYRFSTCQVRVKKSCLFDGKEIAHGASIMAFNQSTVGFGKTCDTQVRTCNDGDLSGNAQFASCQVGEPMSCLHNGKTYKHLDSVVAYESSSVAYGSSCKNETRVCYNGEMSGAYAYASCAVDVPASCLFSGQTIAHGESVQSYGPPSENGVCAKETRVCTNGVLSGSYTSMTCAVVNTESNAGSICSQVRDVQGDMRVYVEPGAMGAASKLEFGTFADNYWEGSSTTGKSYDRQLKFMVPDITKVSEMTLVRAAYDDWLLVKVNGKTVYVGPKAGADRLIHRADGKVQYSATGVSKPELSTSWDFALNINILPYLVQGENVIETKTIVSGLGESALKFLYKNNCPPPQ